LSAGVWTDKLISKMVNKLRAGVVWANTYNQFDPTSPCGDYKEIGFARERGSQGCPCREPAQPGIHQPFKMDDGQELRLSLRFPRMALCRAGAAAVQSRFNKLLIDIPALASLHTRADGDQFDSQGDRRWSNPALMVARVPLYCRVLR